MMSAVAVSKLHCRGLMQCGRLTA